jgi:hypothetical protein
MAKDFADKSARRMLPYQKAIAGRRTKKTATAETCAVPSSKPIKRMRASKNTREGGEPVANVSPKPSPREQPAKLSAKAGDCGQRERETLLKYAAVSKISGQQDVVTHTTQAGGGESQHEHGSHFHVAIPALIDGIREQWRNRQGWVNAQVRLTLQCDALCRRLVGGDKEEAKKLREAVEKGKPHELSNTALMAIAPILRARDDLLAEQKRLDRGIAKLAKKLPGYDYVKQTLGAGDLYFVGIVGEAGDIGSYKSVSALWKRMGLAVIGDGRQRRVTGVDALEHGYSPQRRAHMWVMGDCIIRAQVRKDPDDEEKRIALGPLGHLYLDRKAYEAERVETKKHAHNRAKRYVEKRFLRELYAAWRGHDPRENQQNAAPPQISPTAQEKADD